MSTGRADAARHARWLAYAPRRFTTAAGPTGPPAVIQLVAAEQEAVLELRDGQIDTRVGRADKPDLVFDGPPPCCPGC